jgi:hypothetical protein
MWQEMNFSSRYIYTLLFLIAAFAIGGAVLLYQSNFVSTNQSSSTQRVDLNSVSKLPRSDSSHLTAPHSEAVSPRLPTHSHSYAAGASVAPSASSYLTASLREVFQKGTFDDVHYGKTALLICALHTNRSDEQIRTTAQANVLIGQTAKSRHEIVGTANELTRFAALKKMLQSCETVFDNQTQAVVSAELRLALQRVTQESPDKSALLARFGSGELFTATNAQALKDQKRFFTENIAQFVPESFIHQVDWQAVTNDGRNNSEHIVVLSDLFLCRLGADCGPDSILTNRSCAYTGICGQGDMETNFKLHYQQQGQDWGRVLHILNTLQSKMALGDATIIRKASR